MYTLTLNTSINIEQLLFEMFLVLLLKKFNAELAGKSIYFPPHPTHPTVQTAKCTQEEDTALV